MKKQRVPLIVVLVVLSFAPSLAHAWLLPHPCLLQVVSIDPWELELWEASETGQFPRFQTEENGLPSVTPERWRNAGRPLVPEDVGQTFECDLWIPDMGGPFRILNEDESIEFHTKWEMSIHPDAEDLAMQTALFAAMVIMTLVFVVLGARKEIKESLVFRVIEWLMVGTLLILLALWMQH